jgi:heat shock protein HslJ
MRVRAAAVVMAVLSAVALTGCAGGGTSSPDPRLEGVWHLASASVNGGLLNLGSIPLALSIGDADHTYVTSYCGRQSASVTGGLGAVYVRVAPLRSPGTCLNESDAALSRTYLRALDGTSFASIADGSLVLSSPTSSIIYLRRAPTPSSDFRHTRWILASVPSGTIDPNPAHSTEPDQPQDVVLTFDGNNGVSLLNPCSRIDANYQQQGDIISIGAYTNAEQSGDCSPADRERSQIALALMRGALSIENSSDGTAADSWLVITNLSIGVPSVWHTADAG